MQPINDDLHKMVRKPNVQNSGAPVLRSPALRDGGWTGPTSVNLEAESRKRLLAKTFGIRDLPTVRHPAAESPDVVCRA